MSESVVGSDALPRASALRGRARAVAPRDLLAMAAAAGLYYGSAKIGYQLEFAGPVAAIVWLPVGVGISFLTLGGLRLWPGVLAGDLLANGYSTIPIGSALGQTVGNMLEMGLAAWLLRRLARHGSPLASVRGLAGMVGAILAGCAVSATVGTLSLRAGDVVTWAAIPRVWRTWWLGDASGALVLVPLALAWWPVPRLERIRRRLPEALAMVIAVATASEVGSRTDTPLAYLVFPPLIWAGLRFGSRGATVAVAIAAGIFVWNTTHYHGPFHFESITRAVLNTQLYIAVVALTALCLAAVVAEREAFAARLGRSRAQLVTVAEAERRRVERNLHDGAQQRLLALALNLGLAAEESRQAPEQAPALFVEAERELLVAVDELREFAHGMPPALVRNLGLGNAIRTIATHAAVPAVEVDVDVPRLDEETEATAFYVVSEAVANTRHAQAASLAISVIVADGGLALEIADDGVGGAVATPGSGLDGLRERVESRGGRFELVSRAGAGTRVAATIPAVPA